MYFNITFPGLEDVNVKKVEQINGDIHLSVECERKHHTCPDCKTRTNKIHDYRIQKIQHLKLFERLSYIFYKRRRYSCPCGKRFAEQAPFVARYQRHSIEWNQAIGIRAIKGKTFKEVSEIYHTSPSTVVRRFDRIASSLLNEVIELPEVIAIDEYKGDTDRGKFQLIIADGITRKPLDILENRFAHTIEKYLREKGNKVKIVIMDMSHSFKSAVLKALGNPIVVADRFHFCRYIYWAVEGVRRRVQKDFHPYDRKKCKRSRYVFLKASEKLSDRDKWLLKRYCEMSPELKLAYELKEKYNEWFNKAKTEGYEGMQELKDELYVFYKTVEESGIPEFIRAIKTFKNWQKEILNSFAFNYSNGFLEALNNVTKVIKRNAYGFRNFDRFRLKILLTHQLKGIGVHVG